MNEAQLPPEGTRYHNPDNLPSAGEPPWRFTVERENPIRGEDEYWSSGEFWDGDITGGTAYTGITYRTRRPLPAIPEPSVPAQGEATPIVFHQPPHLADYVDKLHIITGPNGMCMCGTDGVTCSELLRRVSHEIGSALLVHNLIPNPSPVAPSDGEEVSAAALATMLEELCDIVESKEKTDSFTTQPARAVLKGFRTRPPTPPPAEAPTPEHEQWHALPVTMASRSLSYQGKVLGTFGNETAMRLAATHNDEVAALRRELSAMRQERQKPQCEHCGSTRLILTGCPRCGAPQCCDTCCQITTLQFNLATVTAERDELKERIEFTENVMGENGAYLDNYIQAVRDIGKSLGVPEGALPMQLPRFIGDAVNDLKTERDTARASAESARKDGEWRPIETAPEAEGVLVTDGNEYVVAQRLSTDWIGCLHEDLLPFTPTHWMPLPAARLTSEGGR